MTISGQVYRYAGSVRVLGPDGLAVDGAEYITPQPISDYPARSRRVYGPNRLPVYIWTETQLVMLIAACVESPPPLGCA